MTLVYLGDGSSSDTADLIGQMAPAYDLSGLPALPAVTRATNCVPVDAMTNTLSHKGGFADTTTAGVQDESSLVHIPGDTTSVPGWDYAPGVLRPNADNPVIDGYYLTNTIIYGDRPNLIVRNCVFEMAGDGYAVQLRGARGCQVVGNTIRGFEQYGPGRLDNAIRDMYAGASVNSSPATILNNHIYWCSTGINNVSGGGLIQGNYIHSFGDKLTAPFDHHNGIQIEGADGTLLTIRGNTILVDQGQTDAIMLSGGEGTSIFDSDRLVIHNLLAGGGFTMYGRDGSDEIARRIRVIDNHFSRIYYPDSGFYGPLAYWDFHPSNEWRGNVWDDTGAPLDV